MTFVDESKTKEEEAIEELKRRFKGALKPEMYEDRHTFYRFLKARDFNLDQSEIMLRNHLAWRKEWGVENIITNFNSKEALIKHFPGCNIGLNKEGCPVKYFHFGNLDPRGIRKAAKFVPEIVKHVIQMMEIEMVLADGQAKKLGKPLPGSTYIIDFKNFSFSVASDKKTLEHCIYLAKMYQDNYPERLNEAYVINVSSYFTIFFNVLKFCLAASMIKKIRIFSGSDNYQEALLNVIEADDLPVFLGGNKTDPNGDPLCKSFMNYTGRVPEKYFVNKTHRKLARCEGVKKLSVSRSSSSEIKLEVTEPESVIQWEFETKSRDIAFGLYYKEIDGDLSRTIELVPLQRLDTEEFSETGIHRCHKTGTYTLLFDNSFSWFRSKEIYYRVGVISNKEYEEELKTINN